MFHLMHRLFHTQQIGLPAIGEARRFLRHGHDMLHGFHQIGCDIGNPLHRFQHRLRRLKLVRNHHFFFPRRRGEFGGGRRDLHAGTLHLPQNRAQGADHFLNCGE